MHCGMITIENELMNKIVTLQEDDGEIQEKRKLMESERAPEFKLGPNNIMRCNGRVCS